MQNETTNEQIDTLLSSYGSLLKEALQLDISTVELEQKKRVNRQGLIKVREQLADVRSNL